jgi:integrase
VASPEKREGKLTGFWYGEVDRRNKGGQRFRRRFETKREAEGYEAYVKAAGCEPENVRDAKLSGPTFAATVALMRAQKAGKRERDKPGQGRVDWLLSRIGNLTIQMITTSVIDGIVADLEKRPAQTRGKGKLSVATINRYLSVISGVITFARARVKANETPINQPEIPWKKEAGARIHWFSDAQEATLVGYMQAQGWMAEALSLRVLCATGLRWGEFMSLEPHQCQAEWILLDATKTDTPRDVPIDDVLASELKAMVVTKMLPDYRTMRMHLQEAVKACGYNPKLGIHNARHAAATRLTKLDVPTKVVQDFLGHKNIKTTLKYLHVESDDLYKAMRKLNPRRGELTETAPESAVVPFKKSG